MAWPQDPLEPTIELQAGGLWIDVSDDIYLRDRITIERGRQDEGSAVDPAKCSLTINNRSGRYSPRNPRSDLYGLIGRNTPLRISVPYGNTALTNLGNGRATCPDTAALDVTGDLDIRVDLEADDWTSGGNLIGKYGIVGNQRSWVLNVGSDDLLSLIWSSDGTLATRRVVSATTTLPLTPGRRVLRATLDVDNGAGGHVVRFFYSSSMTGPWTQIGDAVTGTGTTSVYASTAQVQVGDVADLEGAAFPGRYYAAQVRNGINGPIVAHPIFSAQTPGATSFADAQGNTWAVGAGTVLDRRAYRFHGEVSSWPTRWDVSGRDVYVPLEAAGILRRLGQGIKPLRSALYREIVALAQPYHAYWPLEDEAGATQAASGYPGRFPMNARGEVTFGEEGPAGSAGAVSVGETGELIGRVPASGNSWLVAFWYELPRDFDAATDTSLAVQWLTLTNTFSIWNVRTEPGLDGRLGLSAFDGSGTVGGASFGTIDLRNRGPVQVAIIGEQVGANVRARLYIDGVLDITHTTAPDLIEPISWAGVDVWGGATSTAGRVSHLIVATADRLADVLAHQDAAAGHAGETAVQRVTRIATEEDIPLSVIDGAADGGSQIGAQRVATALELLADVEAADGGVLVERLTPPGLTYRTRASDYTTDPVATLDYTAGDVAPPLEPVDDDQALRNDITVTRTRGSSVRVVQETGPLSVQAPPAGVGRYDEQRELILYSDDQLLDVASWRLWLGTQDAARYPTVHIDLAAAPHLIEDVMQLDVRSRIRLTNLPEWLPPGDEDLLVEGYTETIGVYDWDLTLNCTAGNPWNVAVTDDLVFGRADTAGAALAAAIGTATTSLSVATSSGPLWTTTDVPFDIVIGGEAMTVTAVTGASSPQTLTVTRAVNGVTKSHTAGADVRLAHPAIVAL